MKPFIGRFIAEAMKADKAVVSIYGRKWTCSGCGAPWIGTILFRRYSREVIGIWATSSVKFTGSYKSY